MCEEIYVCCVCAYEYRLFSHHIYFSNANLKRGSKHSGVNRKGNDFHSAWEKTQKNIKIPLRIEI